MHRLQLNSSDLLANGLCEHVSAIVTSHDRLCVCACFWYSVTFAGAEGPILLDYSKNIVTKDTMKLLFQLVSVEAAMSQWGRKGCGGGEGKEGKIVGGTEVINLPTSENWGRRNGYYYCYVVFYNKISCCCCGCCCCVDC